MKCETRWHKCSFTFFMKCADIVHFIFAPRTFLNFKERRGPPVCFVFFSSFVREHFSNIHLQFEKIGWHLKSQRPCNIELDHLLFYQTSIFYSKQHAKDESIPTFSRCPERGTRRTRKTMGWQWKRRKRRKGWGEAMIFVFVISRNTAAGIGFHQTELHISMIWIQTSSNHKDREKETQKSNF